MRTNKSPNHEERKREMVRKTFRFKVMEDETEWLEVNWL
jgi:hypothetical protein